MLTDSKKIQALRELLDPCAVAAWLDEVEKYRMRAPVAPPVMRSSSKPKESQPLMTVGELAAHLRVSQNWICERSHRVGFPVLKVRRSLRFGLSEVQVWLVEMAGMA